MRESGNQSTNHIVNRNIRSEVLFSLSDLMLVALWSSNQTDSMLSSPGDLKIVFHIYHINLSLPSSETLYWGVKSSYFPKESFFSHIILPRHCITLCVYVCVWWGGLVRNTEAIYCIPVYFTEMLRICEEEITAFCVHNAILDPQLTNGESAIFHQTLILSLCIQLDRNTYAVCKYTVYVDPCCISDASGSYISTYFVWMYTISK